MQTAIRIPVNALSGFIGLQCLDALTTLLFLRQGVSEGNPLVSWALHCTPAPWLGLVMTKLTAILIGFYCCGHGRAALLRWANRGYGAVVLWNLIAIAAGAAARH